MLCCPKPHYPSWQVSALSHLLWLPSAASLKGISPSLDTKHPVTEGYACFTIPTFSPNSGQLCRACPASELAMASAKALLWLHPSPVSPHAQSCSSYRCGSQSAPQHIFCTDSLSSSMFPRNHTFTSRAWKG